MHQREISYQADDLPLGLAVDFVLGKGHILTAHSHSKRGSEFDYIVGCRPLIPVRPFFRLLRNRTHPVKIGQCERVRRVWDVFSNVMIIVAGGLSRWSYLYRWRVTAGHERPLVIGMQLGVVHQYDPTYPP